MNNPKFSNQVNKILSALLHGKLIQQGEGRDVQLKMKSKVRPYLLVTAHS